MCIASVNDIDSNIDRVRMVLMRVMSPNTGEKWFNGFPLSSCNIDRCLPRVGSVSNTKCSVFISQKGGSHIHKMAHLKDTDSWNAICLEATLCM